jgi:hypothetical protein
MGGRRTANPSRKTTFCPGRKAPSAVPQPRRKRDWNWNPERPPPSCQYLDRARDLPMYRA